MALSFAAVAAALVFLSLRLFARRSASALCRLFRNSLPAVVTAAGPGKMKAVFCKQEAFSASGSKAGLLLAGVH